ncbi:MAG: TonB-dependent receptor plug domain-containing protein [Acidobacteriota bacterium]
MPKLSLYLIVASTVAMVATSMVSPALAHCAGDGAEASKGAVVQQQGQSQQQGQAKEQKQQEKEPPSYEETVVVTASRTEQLLLDAPTAISVINSAFIETSPARNYADLLRAVPGLNVSQLSARDINLTSRAATNTLATSQLVMVDGRTVYQDFFGFVLWDLVPVNFTEIDQIEVVRGPGSAVWGANAMTGVVNILTKSPRQLGNGTSIRLGGGERSTGLGSVLHSGLRGPWSYKLSTSFYTQNAWPRPETLPNGSPGNIFPNEGTDQPKFDARLDRQLDANTSLSFSGGIAGTSGIINSGIGPFSIDNGSRSAYLRGDYNRRLINVRAYANFLRADSNNLLNGLQFDFDSNTFDFSAKNTMAFDEGKHLVTYGGNARFQTFDLTIAPEGDDRQEGGAFIEDSFTPDDHLTINLGGRVDGFSSVDGAVFSPRVSALVRPIPDKDYVFRVSFNRAFRAPSVVNNTLDTAIFQSIPLGNLVGIPPLGDFFFPTFAVGNRDLNEEQLDQIEVGFRGVFADNLASVDFAYYRTSTEDNIDFFARDFYNPLDVPAGWPLPPALLAVIPLPKLSTYRNIGDVDNQGVEVGLQLRPYPRNQVYFNYSWQDTPDPTGIDLSELNIPPANRFNVGLSGFYQNWLYSTSINFVDDAFWTDVLPPLFDGPTGSFTTLNASIGYRLFNDTTEASLRATNLTDVNFQQHVFGDVIGRRVIAEVGYTIR